MRQKMEYGVVLKILVILAGAALAAAALWSLAKRRMTELFCLLWDLIGALMIAAGCLLHPAQWPLGRDGLLVILLTGFCLLYAAFFLSVHVSELTRRNLELSIQVSLLNAEVEELRHGFMCRSGEKEGDTQNYEKNPDCD